MQVLRRGEGGRIRRGLPPGLFDVETKLGKAPPPLPLSQVYLDNQGPFSPVDYLLNNGTTNPDVIRERQAFVIDYQRLATEPGLEQVIATAMAFAEQHCWLREPILDKKMSEALKHRVDNPRIEVLLRDGQAEIVTDEVKKLMEALAPSTTTAIEYGGNHAATPLGSVAGEMGRILQEAQEVPGLTAEKYIERCGWYSSTAFQDLEQLTADHHTMEDLSNCIAGLAMVPGTIESESSQPLVLDNVQQLRFERKPQSPVSLTIGNRAVVLTGENGSGKTFAVEALVEALLTMSSTGHASGNVAMPPVASIDMLARPAGGNDSLSAFGVEVRQWANLLERLEQHKPGDLAVVVSDEPFSSTDTEGQGELLGAVLRRLRELGARAVITTHADVKDISDTAIDTYHIIKHEEKRTITPGIGDADSLRVAEEHGLGESIVARAQELMEGAMPELACRSVNELQAQMVAEYYGDEPAGMNWLYSQKPAERPVSSKERRDHWSKHPYREPVTYDTVKIYGKTDQVPTGYWKDDWRNRAIADLLGSATNSPDIIGARQEFMARLADYENLDDFEAALTNFMSLYWGLSGSSHIYTKHEHIGLELAQPLDNLPNTLFAMLCRAQSSPGYDDFYDHYGDDKKKSMNRAYYHYQAEVLATLREVANKTADDAPRQLFAAYLEAYTLAAEAANTKEVVDTEKLREACYRYLDQVDDGELGDEDTRKWRRGRFDEIFYEWQEYDDEGELLWPPVNTGKWRSPLGRFGAPEILRMLELPRGGWEQDSINKEIVVRAFANVTPATLPATAQSWSKLYTTCQEYSDKGVITPIVNAAAVLNWVANDTNLVAEVAGHLRSIDGTITNDLAAHFEQTVAAYFDGKPQASQALPRMKKLQKDRGDDSLWPIAHQPLFDYSGARETPYNEASQLSTLVAIARRMASDAYRPVARADAPRFIAAKPLLRPDSLKPFSVAYQAKGGIELLTGANGSGKTEALKTMFATVASAQTTGYVPGEARLPIYDKIIYIDRPLYKTAKGKSSFMADVANWKDALETLDTAAPSIVFADEPFSTVPAKYQEALVLAMSEWLAARGHRLVMATHNHTAVDRLWAAAQADNSVELSLHHFGAEVGSDGHINYSYELHSGHGPSSAIAVARTLGGQALQRALDTR